MKRILPAVLLALAAALPAHAEGTHPLRIGWVQSMANAPVLIAEEKGYFRDEGLNVELKGFGDGPVIQQAVAAGEIDVAYIGAPPVYQWAARGLDAKIIAKVNYGQAAVIVKADGPIQVPSDLKGKRLAGVSRGSGMDVLLRGYVLKEAAGLSPDADLTLSQMPVGNMNAALDTGVIDAAFSWEPFISQSVLRGAGRVVFDVNSALFGYPWYVIAAPAKTLKERPDDLVKLLRVNSKAIAFLHEHPEEADRIIARSLKLESLKAANGSVVAPEAIVAEARKRLGWSAKIEPSDRAFIQRLIDYSVALGFLDKRLNVDEIIDDSFAAKATAQR
ncbi:putative sulfonate/nitrate transport system substrate-binding protein substrate-binding protein [Rhizobium freirei PRF 81]|uniref:Putative sulfonate/nitrate transport system substrate-binding protein substrate-binding protein n=1 Tax=Rhizobium freirei PRF 81 TaxID=363754 RepID=N6VB31_9HYPH|nr:ABC transporter substrate-binding protein [Rhizobium freirei]ENN88277.1 putative sulfonate/nitrate transport system substrate-binding protein substrate-binding protein [Rhizobium freirei PRF 81]